MLLPTALAVFLCAGLVDASSNNTDANNTDASDTTPDWCPGDWAEPYCNLPTERVLGIYTGALFLLFLVGDVISRCSPRLSFVFYGIGFLTAPTWFIQPLPTWFAYAKIFSIFIPLQLLNCMRITEVLVRMEDAGTYSQKAFFWEKFAYSCCFRRTKKALDKPRLCYYIIFYLVLLINISEATAKGAQGGFYYNAGCGLILLISLPWPDTAQNANAHTIYMGFKGYYVDFLMELPFGWSLLYTSWNAAFVFSTNRPHFLCVCAVLAVPVVRTIIGRRFDLWMQSRVYTLAIRYLIFGYYDIYSIFADPDQFEYATVEDDATLWGIINLGVGAVYFIWFWIYVCKPKLFPGWFLWFCVKTVPGSGKAPHESPFDGVGGQKTTPSDSTSDVEVTEVEVVTDDEPGEEE